MSLSDAGYCILMSWSLQVNLELVDILGEWEVRLVPDMFCFKISSAQRAEGKNSQAVVLQQQYT